MINAPTHYRPWARVRWDSLPSGFGIVPTWVAVADPVWRQRAQEIARGEELGEFNEHVAVYLGKPHYREIVDEKAHRARRQSKRLRAMFDRTFPADWRDYLLIDEYSDRVGAGEAGL